MPMCTKVLVVLGGDLDEELVPRYRRAEQEGTLSIVGYARCTEQGLSVEGVRGEVEIHRVLLSCSKLFPMIAYLRRCAPEIPRAALLDGRIFRMSGLDVPRLFAENVGYAPLQAELTDREEAFLDVTRAEIPRVWSYGSRTVSVGVKSYFGGRIEWGYRGGVQEVRIGNYTSFGPHVVLEVGLNNQHDYRRITTYDPGCMDFDAEDWCSSLGYKSYAGGGTHRFGCLDRTRQSPEGSGRQRHSDGRGRCGDRGGQCCCEGCTALCDCGRQPRADHQVPFSTRDD